ncbi:MAG: leucine-rich repeat protein [Paraprevotella sp.]|nr:leucine-rich repeat protein [Paraprevotella sp.]
MVIPDGVESIRDNTFGNCSGLTSVTIGSGVESIGGSAFYYCSKLLDVYCYAENVPSTQSNAFSSSPIADATLHVPNASVDSYKATAPWSSCGKIVALTE